MNPVFLNGMKRSLVAFVLVAPTLGQPCINDRDTLGFELRNRPDAQMALTGRFERNPPLYYQMRVARLRAKERLTPAENDDLAVALERLGRSEEALAALTMNGRRTSDERYRFFANRGTFRAHRWLKRGAKRSEMHELKVAENDIAKALKINPSAHFGREAVQLEIMRWLGRKPNREWDETLGEWLRERIKNTDPVRGLSGLIVLGGAWESPDVAIAIATLSSREDMFSIGEMAHARYQELIKAGRKPLDPEAAKQAIESVSLNQIPPAGEPPVKVSFQKLRGEAESWHRARTDYMVARLKAGRHPDTDPGFWSEWKNRPMPTLDPTEREGPNPSRRTEDGVDVGRGIVRCPCGSDLRGSFSPSALPTVGGVEGGMVPLLMAFVAVGNRPGGVMPGGEPLKPTTGHRLAAFSRGCFWGMEQRFRRLPGVVATAVGYMGGTELHPSYESIHANRTGHVETVLIEFDPKRVTYARLLKEFETARPGSRSVAWTFDAAQLRTARSRVAEKAKPVQTFWMAEERHQQYAERNGLDLCPLPRAEP